MEAHGINPQQNIIAIIPARLASTRLENKLLLQINGKPLIIYTLEQAKKAKYISRVIVATDDERILQVVTESGNEAILTSDKHQSGSDRIAEIAEILPENSIIVNVQGDEPLISPVTIEKAIEAILNDETADMSTTCEPIHEVKDVLSSDVVKVVTDENGFALYFSRSPIPFPREAVKKFGSLENALLNNNNLLSSFRKHTGLYVYRREFLLKYTKLARTNLEKTEMLEQLRALENGARIKVVEVSENSIGVDTNEDFERVSKIFNQHKITYRAATINDIPQIAKVHVEAWKKSFVGLVADEYLAGLSVEKRLKAFERRFSDGIFYKILVAETENQIVGFVDFGLARDKRPFDIEIFAFYLLQEFQRQGIGEKLFGACQKEILANDFNSMCLDALEISPYRKFYEKMGGEIMTKDNYEMAGIDYKTVVYGWKDLSKI